MRQINRIFCGCLLVAGLVSGSVFAQTNRTEVIGGDEAALRELVVRMTGNTAEVIGGDETSLRAMASVLAGGGPGSNEKVTVYVGILPPDMPFELPLPEDAILIGSIDRGELGGTDVILEVPQPAASITQFYVDTLTDDPWTLLDSMPGATGFVNQESTMRQFCYGDDEAALMVNAAETGDNTSDAHLYVFAPAQGYLCHPLTEANLPPSDDPYALLPQLKTPEGVTLVPNFSAGGGGSGQPGYRSASNGAMLQSDLEIAAIAEAYNQQLKAAGWKQIESESGENMAFSGWMVTSPKGAELSGTFSLAANPLVEGQYMAFVMVQEVPPVTT